MRKKSPQHTKDKDAQNVSVFKNFIDKAKPEKAQVYARIDMEKYERFKKLCEDEGLSMYQALDIAIEMLLNYYEKAVSKKK